MSAPTRGRARRRPLHWYRHAGAGVRAHVALRWATCPFGALDDLVPPSGRILDWGSGHGLLGVWLAERSPRRQVHGVDIDAVKVAVAAEVADGTPFADRLSFASVAADERPPGAWDGVVINDVLYLLEPDAQEALVRSAAAALAPGGVLVVKDMGVVPRWKDRATRAQEQVTVRLLGLTATAAGVHRSPPVDHLVAWLEGEGLDVAVQRLDRGYHCPHVAVVGRAPHPS